MVNSRSVLAIHSPASIVNCNLAFSASIKHSQMLIGESHFSTAESSNAAAGDSLGFEKTPNRDVGVE